MRVTILQPSYLPWLGFFEQMNRSDNFVLLDDVQYTRRDWRNRNRIRAVENWAWLTVPVLQKSRFSQTLLETKIDNSLPWRRKHLETIRQHYSKSPFFEDYFPQCEKIYKKEWGFLFDLCLETICLIKEGIGITTPILRSSELNVTGEKTVRLLSICKELGATQYLSGDAGSNYISEDDFSSQGISLEYQNYTHPVYPQAYSGFVSHLSAIDLLFNSGKNSLEILQVKETEPMSLRCS